MSCDDEGFITSEINCADEEAYCEETEAGAICLLRECDPDEGSICMDGDVFQCDERGTGYSMIEDCGEEQYCADGECQDCSVEICDGLDNDCDGLIDENLTLTCENDCGIGEMTCRNGIYPACTALSEEGELCIDIDQFCETIPIKLEMPLPSAEEGLGVDVVFVFDRSGSFSDDLSTFQTEATQLTNRLGAELNDLAIGLGSFVDAPCYGFGYGDDFGYELNLSLTTELDRLNAIIDEMYIFSGSDEPESQLEAMYQALTGEGVAVSSGSCAGIADIPPSDMEWRDRAISFLFMSTDADFHQPTDVDYPYPHNATNIIDVALERGTRIYTLLSGTTIADSDAYLIAEATGGEVLNLDASSSELVGTVSEAVFDALSNTEVALVPEGDDAGFVTDIFPSHVSGLDLLTNTTLDVTVTLLSTVDPTGVEQIFTFDLVFYINNGEVSRIPVSITIPADTPEVCDNRPPIIRFLDVPESLLVGETTTVTVEAEEPDDNPMFYSWGTSAGTLLEPSDQTTLLTAPDSGGLIDISVIVSDLDASYDTASALVHIRGDECLAEVTGRLDVGLTEGRMVHVGDFPTESNYSGASCGGESGSEGTVILNVHLSGTYLITVETVAGWEETSWVVYIREPDCVTEVGCFNGDELEIELDVGSYFLFLDTNSEGTYAFNLFVERTCCD
jgi:hypothetical protein